MEILTQFHTDTALSSHLPIDMSMKENFTMVKYKAKER